MLFPSITYGPIHSRRLGTSLGINLMPTTAKLCSFDCVYCECGWNTPVSHPHLPSRTEVRAALEETLINLTAQRSNSDSDLTSNSASGLTSNSASGLNVITFSGNGEPTLHPDFEGIIDDTCELRDRYCPDAKVSVLSNATQLRRPDVFRALLKCDNRILKLDSAIDSTMRLIDRPVNHDLSVEHIVSALEQFHGDFTLQTCFLRGSVPGGYIDNTTPEELDAWYAVVRRLRPQQIMIYVIDRATPVQDLEKITPAQMEAIAAPLRADHFDILISA